MRPLTTLPGVVALGLITAACTGHPAGPDAPDGAPHNPAGQDGATHQPSWREGDTRGRWRVVFTGYGQVHGAGDDVQLQPAVAKTPDVTHGALVVDDAAPADVAVRATVTTTRQLRDGQPNPWETGWVLWRYADPDHFYAVALKSNGWEVSKQDPAYPGKQRFLASGHTPTFPVGQPHTVDVVHVGDTAAVRANGTPLATLTDRERPYDAGGVALYTEDARVHFSGTSVSPADALPSWALPATPAATGRAR